MKKVLCLYRVSTKMQVNKETDDIPMQKAECEKFIDKHPDWVFHDEIAEKGISGFKNTSHNRDALNEIMERATRKEFDILLVYMSDRLGRREDDTPPPFTLTIQTVLMATIRFTVVNTTTKGVPSKN